VYGDIREHFAINFDIGLVQPVDKAAVRKSVQTRRRVDAGNPECPELALTLAPITVGILACLNDRLFGCLK